MSHFNEAIEVVLKHEGGLVDHPNDPGGLTNFGISTRWALRLGLTGIINIRELTKKKAIELYHIYFWDAYQMDRIKDSKIAIKVFDTLVNVGPSQAGKFLQRALRSNGYNLIDDGVIGPLTIAAVNTSSSLHLLCALRSEQAGFYRILVSQDPNKKVFLKGWLKRAYDD